MSHFPRETNVCPPARYAWPIPAARYARHSSNSSLLRAATRPTSSHSLYVTKRFHCSSGSLRERGFFSCVGRGLVSRGCHPEATCCAVSCPRAARHGVAQERALLPESAARPDGGDAGRRHDLAHQLDRHGLPLHLELLGARACRKQHLHCAASAAGVGRGWPRLGAARAAAWRRAALS